MISDSTIKIEKTIDAGLTGNSLRHMDQLCVLLSFAGEEALRCEVLPKLKEIGYDIIGPTPLGQDVVELAHKERPDVAGLRIDEPTEESCSWITYLWEELSLPVVVMTLDEHTDGMTAYLNCANAGAFAVLCDSSNLIEVRCAYTAAAQRGAALRDAQRRIEQLERNLANRRTVEQAKWILVQRDDMTEPDAHLALQSAARNTRSPLIDIAQSVIDGTPLPE